jgi:hypothetical protein
MYHWAMRVAVVLFLLAVFALAAPAAAQIDAISPEIFLPRGADVGDVSASSVKVYRLPLGYTVRDHEDRPWGLRITFPLSFGAHEVDAIIDGGKVSDALNTLSVIPGVEFRVPVGERWLLKPFAELGIGSELGGSGTELLTSGGVKCLGVYPGRPLRWMFGSAVRYNGSSIDAVRGAFGSLELAADVQTRLGFSLGGKAAQGGVYGMARYYSGLDIEIGSTGLSSIDEQYEAGISFSTDPVIRIWKLRIPWVAIGYRFGDGIDGYKISLSFPF